MMATVALLFLSSFAVEIVIVKGFERITFIVVPLEHLLSGGMAWSLEVAILTSHLSSSAHGSFTGEEAVLSVEGSIWISLCSILEILRTSEGDSRRN